MIRLPSWPPRSQSVPSIAKRFAPQGQPSRPSRIVRTTWPVRGSSCSRVIFAGGSASASRASRERLRPPPPRRRRLQRAPGRPDGAAPRRHQARDALGRHLGRERRRNDDVDRPQQMRMPQALDALQLVLAGVFEHGAGARHELLDGARHHHLGRAGERGHARADVNCDPAERSVELLDLAGVDAAADVESDVLHRCHDRRRRAKRLRRLRERCKEAVSLGSLLAPAVTLQLDAARRRGSSSGPRASARPPTHGPMPSSPRCRGTAPSVGGGAHSSAACLDYQACRAQLL